MLAGCIWHAVARDAHADPRVETIDGRPWSDAVRELADRLDSEGTLLRVCVRDAGDAECLPCEGHSLEVEGDAFERGACDEATGATWVRLVDRSALFHHLGALPEIQVPVARVLLVGVPPGVAGPQPAATGCHAVVRAFSRDVEHGTFVRLDPRRFVLRVERTDVLVRESRDAFLLESTSVCGGVRYEIADRLTGTPVLSSVAELEVEPEPTEPVPRIATPVATRGSGGVRVRARDPVHDAALDTEYVGFGVAGLGLVALVVIGLIVFIDVMGLYCGLGPATSSTSACPDPIVIPPDVSYAALGTLGVGLAVGTVGLVLDATRSSAPGMAAPTEQAGMGLSLRF